MEFRIKRSSSSSSYGDTKSPYKNAYILKEINPNISFMGENYYVYAVDVNTIEDITDIINETGKEAVVIDMLGCWMDGDYPTIVIYDGYIE